MWALIFGGEGGLGVLVGNISRKGSPKSKSRGECRKLPSFTVFWEFFQSSDFGGVPKEFKRFSSLSCELKLT